MVIDCHYHFTPELQDAEALIAAMDRQGIDRIALMASLCGPITEPPERLVTFMRFCLTRRWLRPLPRRMITRFTADGHVSLPSGQITIHPQPDNRWVFEAAERYPQRFFAWCMVRAQSPSDPVSEYQRWEHHPACVGVKAHPFWHRYRPRELLAVSERLARNRSPLILHLGFDDHTDVLALAHELPELTIILAHAAFPRYADTWALIKERKNILVDLSATAYVDAGIIKQVSEVLGIERCLYGTDGPFGSHGPRGEFDPGLIMNRIRSVFPDHGVQKRILGENFMACLGPRTAATMKLYERTR